MSNPEQLPIGNTLDLSEYLSDSGPDTRSIIIDRTKNGFTVHVAEANHQTLPLDTLVANHLGEAQYTSYGGSPLLSILKTLIQEIWPDAK